MALPAALLSLVHGAPAHARAFVELDERIVAAQPGVVLVRAPRDVHGPILAHAARRLRTSGWLAIEATAREGAPLFREVATHLGVGSSPCDPVLAADQVVQASAGRSVAILAAMPKDGSWDRAVAAELAQNPRGLLLVLVGAGELPAWDASSFEVAGDLTGSDKLRWLSAVAEEAQGDLPASDLRTLEGWWSKARRVSPEGALSLDGASDAARALLTSLALAGRSTPEAALGAHASAALSELAAAGAVVRSGALASLSRAVDAQSLEAQADPAARRAAAELLAGPGFDPDPWAYARAAELFASAGAVDDADAAIAKAARRADDPQVAQEITNRWFAAVLPITGASGLRLRLRAAQRALSAGDAADAQRWCESATALAPSDAEIALLMGRALLQLGDLVASRVSLQKAQSLAVDDELRARVAGELAEVGYLAGDLALAADHARRGIELAQTDVTRLAARNTLGKIHLAEARWNEAD